MTHESQEHRETDQLIRLLIFLFNDCIKSGVFSGVPQLMPFITRSVSSFSFGH